MAAELFIPAVDQLARLSEDAYEEFGQVTMRRLTQLDVLVSQAEEPDDEELTALMAAERQSLESGLEPIIEAVIEGAPIETFEQQAAESVSSALLLAMLLSFAGLNRLRQQAEARAIIGITGDLIKGQLRAIRGNADSLASGGVTLGRARDIPRRRSLGVRSAFETARLTWNMTARRHNVGKRWVNSPHPCPDCPGYDTNGEYILIEQIVPVATFCVCQSSCKCRVATKFDPQFAIQQLQGGSLTEQVQRSRSFLRQTEQDYLKRHGWI